MKWDLLMNLLAAMLGSQLSITLQTYKFLVQCIAVAASLQI